MSEQKLGFYTERTGVGVERDVATLLAPPEIVLDEAGREAIYQFADDLFVGLPPLPLRYYMGDEANTLTCQMNLKEINAMSTAAHSRSYYAEYFDTEAGKEALHAVGLVADTEDYASMRYESMVAASSVDWFINELADRLGDDGSNDAQYDEPAKWFENTAPGKLLDKLERLQEYRTLYRNVSLAINLHIQESGTTDVLAVQKDLLALYYERVNGMVASLYPVAAKTALWLEGQPADADNLELRERFSKAAPTAASLFDSTPQRQAIVIDRLAQRLDLVRNGAARQVDGRIGPISAELTGLVDSLPQSDGKDIYVPVVPAEVLEAMESTVWQADELAEFLTTVLAEWGLLSQDRATWKEVSDRPGPASDGKWQIITTPKVQSLSVGSIKYTMSVPERFKRSLIQDLPTGTLPVSAHELVHVLQTEYSRQQVGRLALARISGRRSGAMQEMGGIHQEQAFFQLVGKPRAINATYYRALQAKFGGANQAEAARAFLEAGGRGEEATTERRVLAANRTLRLYQKGGHDSQPLVYAEQGLVMASLRHLPDEQVRAIAIAGGNFSLHDTARLHRSGLLDLPQSVPHQPAKDVLSIYMRDFYLPA